MEEGTGVGADDLLQSFPRIFERLGQIAGYTWDESIPPFHSSYDHWHIFGLRHGSSSASTPTGLSNHSSPTTTRTSSNRGSPHSSSRPSLSDVGPPGGGGGGFSPARPEVARGLLTVVARVSTHTLRLEREHHLCQTLLETTDPEGKHVVRPFDLVRLPSQQGDRGPIMVSIVESPGFNYLRSLVDFGPAWYRGSKRPEPADGLAERAQEINGFPAGEPISLQSFLDFAVGASECLELLHHGQRTVHGELRGDAFHFNPETGLVKLINFGAGPRSFENGILTSARWSSLSKEVGVKNKLQFIAPEQTGRMIAAPDSRTDIYSLGVLFWTTLTGEPAFDGHTPMDIVQGVLGRRIAPLSSKRIDVPDVLSSIVQKMTMKQIDERYHSASGLKHDLIMLQGFLGDGDGDALRNFKIATRDVSSYFNLPTQMVGRKGEHDRIVRIIERVSKRSGSMTLKRGFYSISSSSSTMSEGHFDSLEVAETSSDGASSHGVENVRTNSALGRVPPTLAVASNAQPDSSETLDSVGSGTTTAPSPADIVTERSPSSSDARPPMQSKASGESRLSQDRASDSPSQGSSALARRNTSQKSQRKGRCEVISIAGAAGLGKSCLVQSVQAEARRCGYSASTKFDQAKKQPFEPVLRLMSSLFRQIFSESDVSTDFHNMIRAFVRPVWSLLHTMLDIPEHLLGSASSPTKPRPHGPVPQYSRSVNLDLPRGAPSPSSSQASFQSSRTVGTASTADFLRGGSSTKSLRFMNTFLDVLRLLAHHKFICLCLDDLQFADEESLELITNIIAAKIKLVVIVTYRQEEMLGAKVRSVLESENANITRIELAPLSEDEIVSYVAAALYRPAQYVVPLAATIQEKTDGNPFEIREMLSTCFRKDCLWYDWKASGWVYDLDRIFKEFEAENYGQRLNNDFVIRRLNELPPSSRTILAWASLIGAVFSFGLVQKLMSREFDFDNASDERERISACCDSADVYANASVDAVAVAGLQAALQAFVLVPGEEDDQFRFAHDRYMQASVSLRECRDTTKMHFLIAQTMMKYNGLDDRDVYVRSGHVCQSVDLIKTRVLHRSRFRDLLYQAAQKAGESGARTSALYYYQNCMTLLQPEPWVEGPDVYYDETLQLFTRCSECLWLTGHVQEALELLQTTLARARTAVDMAPSWVLQSRIYAQSGDPSGAFRTLKRSLTQLGVDMRTEMTWEECDAEFERLREQLGRLDRAELLRRPLAEGHYLVATGAILVETVSAAYWSNSVLFYQSAMKMVALHLDGGTFTQVGLGYLYLGMIAISRFKMVAFGLELGAVSRELTIRLRDTYALGRGNTTYWLMIGHLQHHIREGLPELETSMDSPVIAGDRILSVLNLSTIALSNFFISHDLAEIESFCAYMTDEVRESGSDFRGGTVLISVRQVARALQGKTRWHLGTDVLSDDHHDSLSYVNRIVSHSSSPTRALDIYNSLAMVPLYLYEHYDVALSVSKAALATIDELWTMRLTRLLRFYMSLALLATLRRQPSATTRDADLETVRAYRRDIEDWATVDDSNYGMWLHLLTGELCDVTEDYGAAIAAYEAALDHAQLHGFVLEEALAHELMAGFYLGRGAKRAARTAVKDAIAAYRRISAHGKVMHLAEKHTWLVEEYMAPATTDQACQTELSGDTTQSQYRRLDVDENERRLTRADGEESKQDRTRDWVGPDAAAEEKIDGTSGLPGHGIDVIDLQSILTSSQIISSELDEKTLLPKMCELILDGNSADFAAIIVEEEDVGWAVAASGDHDREVQAFDPALPLAEAEVEDQVSKQIALYCLRSREPVFLQNLLADERFNNVSDNYLIRNPLGKSVIALPILHGGNSLLGALYLEGTPNAFTDRNMTVLQLLVNQMGISIANAHLFKRLRKVSASNESMIESQKRALAQARAAEAKARKAEAEAVRNLRLKEEAAKAKSIFLANVSHELRTPLNGVIGMSELLKATRMTRDQGEYADSIRVCADTLLTVINDILDYSKLEAGKMQLVTTPFNLQDAIQEVVRALARTHQDKELRTVERLALPSTLVLGDPVRIHQILMNLLSNSYKFTPRGTVTVAASVEEETEGSIGIRCAVADTGIGIKQEQLKRLFMPFSQADSSTARRYGGSGLGLSICKSLISAMGGRIWIDSAKGVGTTVSFTLTFPKAPEDAAAVDSQIAARVPGPASASPTPATARPAAPAQLVDLSRVARDELRICIAEDNPINQKIAVSFIQRLGFHVDAYENGLQAVEQLRAKADEGRPYHLVLMDVQMPELDGYDATRAIRLDERRAVREVLVIAMTASAIQGDRELCIDAGMNDYLAKPVRANVLKAMLERYLQQPEKAIPNLQEAANGLAKAALERPTDVRGQPLAGAREGGLAAAATTLEDPGDGARPASIPGHQVRHMLQRTGTQVRTPRLADTPNGVTGTGGDESRRRENDEATGAL
ncbi:MAG: hypothetical protein M1832_000445 [Thelocarpon impressellum]|nr:MAG: hypothetical protein M1832_000445 [Thelocarpon impressellum]